MKQIKKKNSSLWIIYKIFSKCQKDDYLIIYGIIVYFLSGVLTGLVFPMIKRYYFMYGVTASAIPILFLYFTQIFTRDRSKARIVVISLYWSAFAYFGTIAGEYPYLQGKLLSEGINIGENYFNYAVIYLELGKIFNIISSTILIANYFLCVDKFLVFKSKRKSINNDEDVNVNYGEGLFYQSVPVSIRPHIVIYFFAPLILAFAFLYLYYFRKIAVSGRVLTMTLMMLGGVSLIVTLILDSNKVKLTECEIIWQEKSRLKRTRLSYKDIKSVGIQSQLIETGQKKIIIHADTKKYRHIIDGKFLGHKKLSKIIKIIREKAPHIQMDEEAKNLYYEKISVSVMKGGITAYILLILMCINFIATIFVRGIR